MKEGKYLQLRWNNGLELRKGKFRLGCSKKFLTQIALDSKRSFLRQHHGRFPLTVQVRHSGEILYKEHSVLQVEYWTIITFLYNLSFSIILLVTQRKFKFETNFKTLHT